MLVLRFNVARNTYLNDSLAVKFRSHVGWKQDVIWAACLGLTDEAEMKDGHVVNVKVIPQERQQDVVLP